MHFNGGLELSIDKAKKYFAEGVEYGDSKAAH